MLKKIEAAPVIQARNVKPEELKTLKTQALARVETTPKKIEAPVIASGKVDINFLDKGVVDPKVTGNEGHGPIYAGKNPTELGDESFKRFAFNEYLSRSQSVSRLVSDLPLL